MEECISLEVLERMVWGVEKKRRRRRMKGRKKNYID
jgi:hypothetical protein